MPAYVVISLTVEYGGAALIVLVLLVIAFQARPRKPRRWGSHR